jgi:hypothetical protein
VTNVGVTVRLGAIAAVMLSVGAAFAGRRRAIPAFFVYFGAALYHRLVRRDGVSGSMASW